MSTPQYLRKASLIIGTGKEAIDLSDLQFKFSIKAQTLQSPNSLYLRLYNASRETANRIKAWKEGANVVIQAGYDGNYGTVFYGNIIQLRHGKESAVDTYLDITAADGDQAYIHATVNTSLAAGSSAKDHVDVALQAMKQYGISQGYVTELPENKLPRGKVMFGAARDVLRAVAKTTNTDWSIQDGNLNVVAREAFLPGQVVDLTYKTGLIGMPIQEYGGIRIRCLLNPCIKAGRVVKINNASVQEYQMDIGYRTSAANGLAATLDRDGYYVSIQVAHQGDTRGEDWYTDIIALACDNPVGEVLRNAVIPANVLPQGV